MKSIIVFINCIFSYTIYSQTLEIKGKIKEDFTHKPIPYASITYLLKDIGCYATETGTFTLPLTAHVTDSLIQISSIRYKTIILNINTLPNTIFFRTCFRSIKKNYLSRKQKKKSTKQFILV